MRGQPLSWIRKRWLGALKNAEIRHVRFHDLRHTFNTRLMEAGVMQEIRMALMGHSGGQEFTRPTPTSSCRSSAKPSRSSEVGEQTTKGTTRRQKMPVPKTPETPGRRQHRRPTGNRTQTVEEEDAR